MYDSPALPRRAFVIPVVSAALLVTGCGGGGPRQDANEPSGNYRVQVVEAKFPDHQALAKRSLMRITVKNVDTSADLNVTVGDPSGPFGVILKQHTFTLHPGRSRSFKVEYEPEKAGKDSGELEITSNDCQTPLVVVPLSGTARRHRRKK